MGRRRILTFGTTLLAAGDFCTFSWGPFATPIRIAGIYLDAFGPTAQNAVVGLFYAQSSDTPSGTIVNPATIPPGWTNLQAHSHFPAAGVVDPELFKFPWGSPIDNSPLYLTDFPIDVVSVNFHLKVWINNRTGASYDPQGTIALEESPDDLAGLEIDVRPVPGAPRPTTPAPSPAPGTPAPEPPLPPSTPAPTGPPLPAASSLSMPNVRIDPRDPMGSSLKVCK